MLLILSSSIRFSHSQVLAIACSWLLLATSAVAGDLFGPSRSKSVQGAAANWVARAEAVSVDFKVLDDSKTGSEISLNLLPGISYLGRVDGITALGQARVLYQGALVDQSGSSFSLARNQDVLFGTVNTADGRRFAIRHTASGHQVQELDMEGFPGCATDHRHEVAGEELELDLGTVADDGTVFDVMVVYTPNALAAVGGTAAMQALIDLAVMETNTGYVASGINSTINLVHTYEVGENTSGDFGTDLDRITHPADGHMDEVHALRDQYGADLVSLIIDNGGSCGIGWLMTHLTTNFAVNAFSAVHHGCATGSYSFAHELGHNMGSQHDRDNGDSSLYPYSYGWRFDGTNGVQYRTIMAYSPGTRIDRFSNPNVAYQGTATGTASDDNARSINDAALTVSNFRASQQTEPGATLSSTTGILSVGNMEVIGIGNFKIDFIALGGSYYYLYGIGAASAPTAAATFDPATGVATIPELTVIETDARYAVTLQSLFGRLYAVTSIVAAP